MESFTSNVSAYLPASFFDEGYVLRLPKTGPLRASLNVMLVAFELQNLEPKDNPLEEFTSLQLQQQLPILTPQVAESCLEWLLKNRFLQPGVSPGSYRLIEEFRYNLQAEDY